MKIYSWHNVKNSVIDFVMQVNKVSVGLLNPVY